MASIAINIKRSNDRNQPYFFDITRTVSPYGVVAWSETYVHKQDCVNAVNIIRGGKASYKVHKNTDNRYWFVITADSNGRTLCRSNMYASQLACTQDAQMIIREAGQAGFWDQAA